MKVRMGFVSNSSSSSFVLVFPIHLLETYAAEHPVEFKIVNAVMESNDSLKVGVIHEWMNNGGYGTYFDFGGVEGLTDEESEIYESQYESYPGGVTWHFKDWLKVNYPDDIIISDADF